MTWEPSTRPGFSRCRKHGTEFRGAEPCIQCTAFDGESFLQSQSTESVPQFVKGSPSLDQHERWFNSISRKARKWSDALLNSGEYGAAAKLIGESIKARRQATELARRREDWAMVHRLETQWREIVATRQSAKAGGGTARDKQLTEKTPEG
jgi:hypothetical protein